MDEREPDDDLRDLRATDPAADIDAPQALHERIAQLPRADVVPLARRRQPRWLVPAAAAVAVIAVIGAGYAWTSGSSPGGTSTPLAVVTGTPDEPAPPIGIAGDAASSEIADASGKAFQFGGAEAGAQSADTAFGGWGFGWSNRHRFTAPGFEAVATHANVYALDGRTRYSAEDAAAMAAALGVVGEPHQPEYDGVTDVSMWRVGDDTGPTFSLSVWGGAGAGYSSGIPDPWTACDAEMRTRYDLDGAVPDATWEAYSAAMTQCVADTPLPTEEQARQALSLFLATTGVDEAATEITLTTDEQGRTIDAAAARVVENNATEIVSRVWVSAKGTLFGHGATGDLVSRGEYPIVSADEAAARLNDPAYAPRLVSWPDEEQTPPEYTSPSAPPEVPTAGSDVPWPVAEHDIESARLGLALIFSGDDQQYLVPAYEFTASDGTVWSVLALAADALDTTAPSGGFGIWG